MVLFEISDMEDVYDHAAAMLDAQSSSYETMVKKEAEKRYRSRHFKEMNKSQVTTKKNARDLWYNRGYEKGKQDYRIISYCYVCGGESDILPCSDAHQEIKKHLREKRWAHTTCIKK